MRNYRIEAEVYVREVYTVEAESLEQAREMWDNGDVTTPDESEVFDIDSVDITEEDEA